VRYSNGNTVSDKVQKLDIDLCDEQGNVCTKMRGIEYKNEKQNFKEQQEEESSVVATSVPLKLTLIESRNPGFPEGRLKKPIGISLLSAGETDSEKISSFETAQKTSSIVLSDYSFESSNLKRGADATSAVSLYDNGRGIFLIQISESETQNTLSESMIQELLQTLRKIQEAEEAKVLIIAGTDQCFLTGGRRQQNEAIKHKLHQEIASFPFPVIAAMKGDATGAGFLVGTLCDFMICSEEGEYYYTSLERDLFPTEEEESFMIERFDEARAREFLYSTSISTGKQLQEKGWSCQILPKEQVDTYAQKLAGTLAGMPQESLRLLKQHLSSSILTYTKELRTFDHHFTVKESQRKQNRPDTTAQESGIGSLSKQIQMETYEGKVLLVRILSFNQKQTLETLIPDLEDVFSQVHNSTQYRSIVIVSSHSGFFPVEGQGTPDSLVNGLQRIFLESKIPVIAALDSNATGSAWLISLFCDACIYNEKGLFSYRIAGKSPVLSKEAVMMFSYQFGSYFGKEIMLTGAEYSGCELQQRVGTLQTSAPGQVLSTALALGKYWSGFSSNALFSWKKRMSLAIQKKLKRLPAWLEDSTEELSPIHDTPAQIPLSSRVIKATAHQEGILVVKMEDREAKNMFSPDYVEGITEIFQHINETPLYKVVILTGYD
ncbi:MAG: hypothetical protein GY941_27190, partial [Planctomycetes bacterium]|nr:hypothetical protein [Planctomycetota bacterium]